MTIKVSKLYSIIFYTMVMAEIANSSILPMLTPISSSIIGLVTYASMFLMLLIFIRKGFHINIIMLLVVTSAIISLVINDYEERYSPVFRLFSWILLIVTVGPLIYSPSLVKFRQRLLEGLMTAFMWIGAISFVYWAVGLQSLGRGHFSGLMNQSMALAPVAAFGALYAFYLFLKEKRRTKKKMVLFILFIFSSMSVFIAASRTAFIAYMLAFFVYLIFDRFPFRKTIMMLVLLFTVAMASIMTDEGFSSGATNSIGSSDNVLDRGMKNTRAALWANRMIEFNSSPYFGVGFATQKDDIITIEDKALEFSNKNGGRIEPGSTYLMILSMTGLFGAFAMSLLMLKTVISKDFWRRIALQDSYKLAAFVFFSVHFVAEGYIFSSGALFACVFWLLLGATYPYTKINYSKLNSGAIR